MASNPVVLDASLHIMAILAILSAVGGSPAYNVAVALYGILGLYSRIPRALLSLLILIGVTFVADIVQLSVNSDFDFSGSTLSYGSVMTIIMLLMKVSLDATESQPSHNKHFLAVASWSVHVQVLQ